MRRKSYELKNAKTNLQVGIELALSLCAGRLASGWSCGEWRNTQLVLIYLQQKTKLLYNQSLDDPLKYFLVQFNF
jgi:hypothetical protein